jgi:hypothetical protein
MRECLLIFVLSIIKAENMNRKGIIIVALAVLVPAISTPAANVLLDIGSWIP